MGLKAQVSALPPLQTQAPSPGADAFAPGVNFRFTIPDGPDGVRITLDLMRRLVKKWRGDPEMIAFAHSLIAGIPAKDDRAIIQRVFEYVRDRITYRLDANDVEVLRAPDVLIAQGYGDCDDKSTLLSTLLESLGYKTRFVVIGFVPDEYEHVYNEVRFGSGWLPLDSTEQVEMGWSAYDGERRILARMNWNI